MAGSVIREDIVQISFDIGQNPFQDIARSVQHMGSNLDQSITGGTNDLHRLISAADMGMRSFGGLGIAASSIGNELQLNDAVQDLNMLNSSIEVERGLLNNLQSEYDQTAATMGETSTEALNLRRAILQSQNGLNGMTRSASDLTESVELARLRLSGLGDEDEIEPSSFTELLANARELAETRFTDFTSGLRDAGTNGIEKIRSGFEKLKNLNMEDITGLLDRGLGRAIISSKNLYGALFKVAGIGLGKAIQGVGKLAAGAGKAALAVGKVVVKSVIPAMATIGVAAGGALGVAASEATNYKQALNSIQAQTGYAAEDTAKFRGILNNLYRQNMGESYEDIAQGISTVAQQTGQTGKSLENLTYNALLVKDTFEFEVAESTRTATMMMKQFGISGDEAYSLMAQGAQSGLNQNDNLLDSMNEYAVHFSQMGLGAEDMMNMFANGAAEGVFDVDKLGDAVKEFGIKSKDGSDATAEGFKMLGLDAKKMTKDFGAGGATSKAAFQDVMTALSGIKDPVKQNTAGVALFGTMWEDVGAKGVLAMANMQGDIKGGTAALEELNKVKYDDLGSAMEGISKTVKNGLILPIGNQFLPLLNAGASELQNYANQISDVLQDGFQSGDENQIATILENMLNKGTEAVTKLLPQAIGIAVPVLNNLVQAVVKMAPTLLPVLLDGALQLIQGLIDTIASNTAPLVQLAVILVTSLASFLLNAVPQLLTVGMQILVSLAQGIAQQLPTLLPLAVSLLMSLADSLISQLPALIPVAILILQSVVQGVIAALPQLLPAGIQMILALISGIVQAIPTIIDAVINLIPVIVVALFENLPMIIQGGIEILIALADGLIRGVGELILVIPKICIAIIKGLFDTDWIKVGKDLLKGVGKGLLNGAKHLLFGSEKAGSDAAQSVAVGAESQNATLQNTGMQLSTDLTAGLSSGMPGVQSAGSNLATAVNTGAQTVDMTQTGATLAGNLATGINSNATTAISAMDQLSSQVQASGQSDVSVNVTANTDQINQISADISKMEESSKTSLSQFEQIFKTSMNNIGTTVSTGMSSVMSIINNTNLNWSGMQLMTGLQNGILSKRAALMETARGIASDLAKTINTELDVHSPSRKLMWTGNMAGEGLIKGMDQAKPKVYKSAGEMAGAVTDGTAPASGSYATTSSQNRVVNKYAPNFVFHVQGDPDKSTTYKLKKMVKEAIQESYESIGRRSPAVQGL